MEINQLHPLVRYWFSSWYLYQKPGSISDVSLRIYGEQKNYIKNVVYTKLNEGKKSQAATRLKLLPILKISDSLKKKKNHLPPNGAALALSPWLRRSGGGGADSDYHL